MVYCTLCRKTFRTDYALRQHAENSPAHKPFTCEPCNKSFPNTEALAQHTRDSPAHRAHSALPHPNNASLNPGAPRICIAYQRTFPSPESLNQHLQTSSAHTPSSSSRNTTTSAAAPSSSTSATSAPNHPCPRCTRTFTSPEALAQHTRDAPFHNPAHPCPHCPRSFRTVDALAQHIRDAPSPAHRAAAQPRVNDTPLDAFFLAYPAFPYDRAASPQASFAALRRHMRWRQDDKEEKEAWRGYLDALRRELDVWFGGEDELGNWQALCRAVGIASGPGRTETEKECKNALRECHVNLVDLLWWARSGEGDEGGEKVQVFGTVGKLLEYCKKRGKWFPLEEVEQAEKERGGNVVIRHLLRKFWGGKKGRRMDSVMVMRE